jgi:hypothetical protein
VKEINYTRLTKRIQTKEEYNWLIIYLNKQYQLYDKMKNLIFVCYVDFSKAYDQIDRQIFSKRIEKIGIRGNMLTQLNHHITRNLIRFRMPHTPLFCQYYDSRLNIFRVTCDKRWKLQMFTNFYMVKYNYSKNTE